MNDYRDIITIEGKRIDNSRIRGADTVYDILNSALTEQVLTVNQTDIHHKKNRRGFQMKLLDQNL